MMTPEQELRRGENARSVLDSDIYREAYSQIETNLVDRLAKAATKPDEAESLRQLLVALRKVEQYMRQTMLTGRMADEMQERKRTMLERITQPFIGN